MDDFIPTRVSRIKEDAAREFVSINYEKPKKGKAKVIESTKSSDVQNFKFNERNIEQHEDIDEKKKQELEMKRLRYEVMKFGMSGLKGSKAKKANVALAVSLGAKPPKKKPISYKILQDQRRKNKEKQQNQKLGSGHKRSTTKHRTTKGRRKDSGGILKIYGKVRKNSTGKNKK